MTLWFWMLPENEPVTFSMTHLPLVRAARSTKRHSRETAGFAHGGICRRRFRFDGRGGTHPTPVRQTRADLSGRVTAGARARRIRSPFAPPNCHHGPPPAGSVAPVDRANVVSVSRDRQIEAPEGLGVRGDVDFHAPSHRRPGN